MTQVQIRTQINATGVAVLFPDGRLDMLAAATLRERLRAVVQAGQSRLVVDLSGVEAVDSTGLGALISGLKAARKNGGDLRIVKPNESVRVMLELTGLDLVLKSFDSSEAAFP